MTTTEMTPRRVLLDAARVLERGGWCQGRVKDYAGQHCALGAIREVAFCDFLGKAAERVLARSLRLRPGFGSATPDVMVAEWNDDPGRTADEVVTALRKAAGMLALEAV